MIKEYVVNYMPDVKIRYGKEEGIENSWKEIICEEDRDKRITMIDALVV